MSRPSIEDMDAATWLALKNVNTAGADRQDVFGAAIPARSAVHLALTRRKQSAITCFVGTMTVEGVEVGVSKITTTRERVWTSVPEGEEDPVTVKTQTWINEHTMAEEYHLLQDAAGVDIAPAPVCTPVNTNPDPPLGWDDPPSGYNGPGQPVASLTTDSTDLAYEASTLTPAVLLGHIEGGLGAGTTTQQKFNAIFNRRRVHLGASWSGDPQARTSNTGIGLEVDSTDQRMEVRDLVISIQGHRIPCVLKWTVATSVGGGSPTNVDGSKVCNNAEGWSAEITLAPEPGESIELTAVAVVPLF